MNREEKEKLALLEWREALAESIKDEEAMVEKLKAEGTYIHGLDTNKETFRLIDQKLNRRLREIQEKYR